METCQTQLTEKEYAALVAVRKHGGLFYQDSDNHKTCALWYLKLDDRIAVLTKLHDGGFLKDVNLTVKGIGYKQ